MSVREGASSGSTASPDRSVEEAGWGQVERRSALAALQAQEQQYRAIFDGSVDGMVLWDDDLRVVDVNDAFVRMTGLAREEVIGRHWSERADADDFRRLLGLIRGALEGRVGEATTTVTRADGSLFHIEVRYLPVDLGARRHALGIGRDVSERLKQERALQRSEEQYRGIFNASADALVLRDAAFRIVDVNATYESMSGYTRDEVLGVDRVLANPPDAGATIRGLHEQALAGTPIVLETELVRRDGLRYALELRGVPIEHRGEPHVLYIGRDITVARKAQAALRDSEEQYRAIFNASSDGLVLRDKQYRAVDVNPAYLAITGFSREEVLAADRVLAQRDPTVQRLHREQHDRILAGESVRFEATGVRKDGSKVEVEVSAMRLMYRGEPHVLYAARDIGERREAEARRAELQLQLRQAQKMEAVGHLTGGIAHDFNNILTSVMGYLALGLERADALGDATLQRQLGRALGASQRARDLIAQMLAFARRQRGDRRTLALTPLIDHSLQLLRATLPSSTVVDFVAIEDAPSVLADPVQLEQVLFNLCINARDAMEGAGIIRVRLGWHRGPWHCASCRSSGEHESWIELGVADSGTGIAPEVLDRIFEPFVSTKEVGRGSGMGLAMVHGIVHDHGGHVLVETAPGAGAVFRVVLPPAEADQPTDAPASEQAAVGAGRAMRGRVMVVEDEVMVGDFMAEMLRNWGLDVVLERDPQSALAWLEDLDNPVDLLITDQTMPQLTGLALAQRATAVRRELPVLLYSGNAADFDAAELERHGVRGTLRKPVDAEALRALMGRWLDVDDEPAV
jgi:PAS domain S-box-containing protein